MSRAGQDFTRSRASGRTLPAVARRGRAGDDADDRDGVWARNGFIEKEGVSILGHLYFGTAPYDLDYQQESIAGLTQHCRHNLRYVKKKKYRKKYRKKKYRKAGAKLRKFPSNLKKISFLSSRASLTL